MSLTWLFPVETGLMDFAFVATMVNWMRRRNRAQVLNTLDGGTATPVVDDVLSRLSGVNTAAPNKLHRAQLTTAAAKRVVGSQAFYLLTVAAFNNDSYLHREGRSFLRMLSNRPDAKEVSGNDPLMRI